MLCSRRHQVIVLPLMVAVSVLGCLAWWAPNGAANATPHERIYAPNAAGERLAAVLLGELVLWDIPLTFLPTIWSPAAMAHHVCTALLALLALTLTLTLTLTPTLTLTLTLTLTPKTLTLIRRRPITRATRPTTTRRRLARRARASLRPRGRLSPSPRLRRRTPPTR